MKQYRIELALNEEEVERIMQREYDRALNATSVAANGAAILRDYGAVLSFTRVDKVLA